MTDEVEDFFAKPAGAPSFKFGSIGSGLIGEVVSTQIMDQTDFADRDKVLLDKNGNPKKQLQVILQTDLRNFEKVTDKAKVDKDGNPRDASEDTGTRAIYVKGYMTDAVRDALTKAGVTKLEAGGRLGVKHVGEKDTGKGNPAKLYEAVYTKPAVSNDSESFLAGAESSSPAQAAPETAAAADDDEPPF